LGLVCQSKSFSASANPIIYHGATPVIIDSEAETWNMCPNALTDTLESFEKDGRIARLKAIILVHL
jgi:dTDP-4-amino-4,6-dideoxygalactose transaminase